MKTYLFEGSLVVRMAVAAESEDAARWILEDRLRRVMKEYGWDEGPTLLSEVNPETVVALQPKSVLHKVGQR